MPVNESKIVRRERWPLKFDLEGAPRQTAERERLLEQERNLTSAIQEQEESPDMPPVNNVFAVDYQQPTDTVVDINNPPNKRYVHQEFPKMIYHHETGHVLQVKDAKELKAAKARGFDEKPSPAHDYTKVRSGMIAPKKAAYEPREQELSADQLATLDAADAGEEVEISDEEQVSGESEASEGETGQQDAPRSRGRRR